MHHSKSGFPFQLEWYSDIVVSTCRQKTESSRRKAAFFMKLEEHSSSSSVSQQINCEIWGLQNPHVSWKNCQDHCQDCQWSGFHENISKWRSARYCILDLCRILAPKRSSKLNGIEFKFQTTVSSFNWFLGTFSGSADLGWIFLI